MTHKYRWIIVWYILDILNLLAILSWAFSGDRIRFVVIGNMFFALVGCPFFIYDEYKQIAQINKKNITNESTL